MKETTDLELHMYSASWESEILVEIVVREVQLQATFHCNLAMLIHMHYLANNTRGKVQQIMFWTCPIRSVSSSEGEL